MMCPEIKGFWFTMYLNNDSSFPDLHHTPLSCPPAPVLFSF